MSHKHFVKDISLCYQSRMSSGSCRHEVSGGGRWGVMKHSENGVKLVRGAVIIDDKAH